MVPWRKQGRSRRRRAAERVRRIALVLALFVTAAPAASIVILRFVPPPATSFMVQRRIAGWVRGEAGLDIEYRWTPLRSISPYAGLAVVAAEDQKFPSHRGFDVQAIEDALEERERGERVRGASTISQQVAKNLFLWSGRSFVRKGVEAYLTVLVETLWPKRRILEVYVNTAELGNGVYGVGAAARRFFGKAPRDLTPYEAALLAAVLPNPRKLRADHPSRYVKERADWISRQMVQLGGPAYLEGI